MSFESEANKEALRLYSEAVSQFEIIMDDGSRLPGSLNEIQFAESKLREAKSLQPDGQEAVEALAILESILKESQERVFTGSKWMIGILLIVVCLFWVFPAFSAATDEAYTAERAKKIMDSEIKTRMESREYLSKKEQTDKIKQRIKYNEQKLEKLQNYTPEEYAAYLSERKGENAQGDIRTGLLWIVLIVAYFFASRTPVYLLNRRKKEYAFMTEGSSIVKKIIFGIIGSVLAVPVTTTVTRWSDGTTSRESDALPLIFVKIILPLLLGMFIAVVMMYVLIPITLLNYLRNYHSDSIRGVCDFGINSLKSIFGKGNSNT